MANTVYPNFYLSNEVEDQYKSHLDLQQFCTVDNNLVGTPGMIRKINVYKATDGTEKLTMGNGNTKSIEVGYTQKQYEILLAQNRFKYYDEQAMTDPQLVPVGTRHMGTDMFNTVNKDIYAEFAKATQVVVGTKFNFDMFAHECRCKGFGLTNAQAIYGVELLCITRESTDLITYTKRLSWLAEVSGGNPLRLGLK